MRRTSISKTDLETPLRLRRCIRILDRQLWKFHSRVGLSPSQYEILVTIAFKGPIQISDLVLLTNMNPTMVSRVLTKLEGDKLIQRSRSADDARTAILSSTKSGHEVLERVRMQSALYLDEGLSQLSHNDFQVLVDALPVLEKLIELTPRSAPSE